MAELKIKADSGGGTVALKGPATTTSNAAVQLTLPVDDGTSGQYLKTDGSGALSWGTVSAGVDGISSSADATAITIDSSERVMIGTTTPGYSAGDDLTIQPPSGSGGITIRTGTSDSGKIYFADGTSGGDQYKGTITYSHANDTLALASPNGDALTIETDRDVTIEDGDLIIGTSGHGIDFAANTDDGGTSQATVLDDYEEGTWTPTMNGSSGNWSYQSSGMTTQAGTYVKVGNVVTVTARMIWNSSGSGAGGLIYVQGLPYTCVDQANIYPSFNFGTIGGFTASLGTDQYLVGYLLNGNSYGRLDYNVAGGGTNSYVDAASTLNSVAGDYMFTCTYRTS